MACTMIEFLLSTPNRQNKGYKQYTVQNAYTLVNVHTFAPVDASSIGAILGSIGFPPRPVRVRPSSSVVRPKPMGGAGPAEGCPCGEHNVRDAPRAFSFAPLLHRSNDGAVKR